MEVEVVEAVVVVVALPVVVVVLAVEVHCGSFVLGQGGDAQVVEPAEEEVVERVVERALEQVLAVHV